MVLLHKELGTARSLSYLQFNFSGLWNLHTISLLVMLSRGPGGFHDYIKPMKYMDTGSTDQVGSHLRFRGKE